MIRKLPFECYHLQICQTQYFNMTKENFPRVSLIMDKVANIHHKTVFQIQHTVLITLLQM